MTEEDYLNDSYVPENTQLNELFNQPYQHKWTHRGDDEAVAEFTLSNGNDVVVEFALYEDQQVWKVEFSVNGEYAATGEGDQFRIFATVMATIKEFIYHVEPPRIIFHAEKNVASNSNSRAKLYSRMVRKFAGQVGYRFEEHSEGWRTTYILTSNSINESAAGRITAQNTTVDVKPGETRRQAAKFGNKINSKNEPPLLHANAHKNSDPHTLSNLGLAESASKVKVKKRLDSRD